MSGGGGERAQGGTRAVTGVGGASLPGWDQAHHTEHLCAGFMGEFLGQWKTRPNSSNCETLPRTLPGEGSNSDPGTPCPPRLPHCHAPHLGHLLTPAAPHPPPQGCPPRAFWCHAGAPRTLRGTAGTAGCGEGWHLLCLPISGLTDTCSAPGHVCPSAPGGRWTGIAA